VLPVGTEAEEDENEDEDKEESAHNLQTATKSEHFHLPFFDFTRMCMNLSTVSKH
jgi:hypothetical protein